MSPAPFGPSHPYLLRSRNELKLERDVSMECVLELPVFDRFVFVMSVLEGYSDRDCALLLLCSCADVEAARIRAFQQISKVEKSYASYSSGPQPYVVDADWLECG
jgi:DNA-directed RNA polymerase specialized sigma24 family protein